jgi:hypothetical protein
MKGGKKLVTTQSDAKILALEEIDKEQDSIIAVSENRVLIFSLDEMKELEKGKGIKLINLKKDDILRYAKPIRKDDTVKLNGEQIIVEEYIAARARVGKSFEVKNVPEDIVIENNIQKDIEANDDNVNEEVLTNE